MWWKPEASNDEVPLLWWARWGCTIRREAGEGGRSPRVSGSPVMACLSPPIDMLFPPPGFSPTPSQWPPFEGLLRPQPAEVPVWASFSLISSCPQLWSFLNISNFPKTYFFCQPLHTHTPSHRQTHTNYPWILFTFQIKWQQSLSTKADESIAPTSFSNLLPSPLQVPAFIAATVGSWLLP